MRTPGVLGLWLLGCCLLAPSARAELPAEPSARERFIEYLRRGNLCGDWDWRGLACRKDLCERAQQPDADPGAISLWVADCYRRQGNEKESIQHSLELAAEFGNEEQRRVAYRRLGELGVEKGRLTQEGITCGTMYGSGSECRSSLWACAVRTAGCSGSNACETVKTLYVSHTPQESFMAALGERPKSVLPIDLLATESCSCMKTCADTMRGLKRCLQNCQRDKSCFRREKTCRLVFVDVCGARVGVHCREKRRGEPTVETSEEFQIPEASAR